MTRPVLIYTSPNVHVLRKGLEYRFDVLEGDWISTMRGSGEFGTILAHVRDAMIGELTDSGHEHLIPAVEAMVEAVG